MSKLLWIASVLVVVQSAHCYILLTANLDDVQNVAKQLLDSPLEAEVEKIVRRAYNVFNNQLWQSKARARDDKHRAIRGESDVSMEYRRKNDEKDEVNEEQDKMEGKSEKPGDENGRRRNGDDTGVLGKSASFYLSKIKKIFDVLT